MASMCDRVAAACPRATGEAGRATGLWVKPLQSRKVILCKMASHWPVGRTCQQKYHFATSALRPAACGVNFYGVDSLSTPFLASSRLWGQTEASGQNVHLKTWLPAACG